jgi:hypothetical protein
VKRSKQNLKPSANASIEQRELANTMFKIYLDSKKEEIEQNISQIPTKINKSLSIDEI